MHTRKPITRRLKIDGDAYPYYLVTTYAGSRYNGGLAGVPVYRHATLEDALAVQKRENGKHHEFLQVLTYKEVVEMINEQAIRDEAEEWFKLTEPKGTH